MDYQGVGIEVLKNIFKRFAERECKEVSPFYYDLATKIAEDDELIVIASYCKKRQPVPNLFLASVHYLLLKNPLVELAKYYPSITKEYQQKLPFKLFKDFCLKYKKEIIALEQSKIVQTNALNRSAYLMPILSHLFSDKPINIIDIGTSAGLTLNMDKYEYHYNGHHLFGKSPLKIKSKIKEGFLPKFAKPVKILRKIGIDQNPLDLKISANSNWLKALIWADRTERIERIEQAILIARQEDIDFRKASSITEFETIIQEQEESIPLVIYHTHVLYQFTQPEREKFWDLIDKIGSKRDLTYLATEGNKVFKTDYGIQGTIVELTEYKSGVKNSRIVAETNGHANWIKWKNEHLD